MDTRPELLSHLPDTELATFKDAVTRMCDDLMQLGALTEEQGGQIAKLRSTVIIEL